jgi:hypothetical protein
MCLLCHCNVSSVPQRVFPVLLRYFLAGFIILHAD